MHVASPRAFFIIMDVVLFQPDIPQNTGNIARTCAATGCDLILIPPLGFRLSSRQLKRAGLDYWANVHLREERDWEEYFEKNSDRLYFFSCHSKKSYTEASYSSDSLLVFGSETKGLPEKVWERWSDRFVTIPMLSTARCLNLSNCVAIGVYEALRQQGISLE